MESIAISKFKATCLAALNRVNKTGQPLLVTRRGEPVAQVVPPPKASSGDAFGALKHRMKTKGDIVEPLGEEEWEVLAFPPEG